ncbi:MAG: 2OG-Fe(II) oxygenase [Hyphomicrobiales bacterium]
MPSDTMMEAEYRPVAHIPGSLPGGGFVANTPIWGVTMPPLLRPVSARTVETRREEVDIGGKLAFYVENVFDADEADAFVALTERLGYRSEAPGIQTPPGMRQNKSVHWVADETLLGPIFERIRPHLPAVLDGDRLHGRLSHRINMYRYDHNDIFNLHIDGDWPGYGLSADRRSMVEWDGVFSKITMLLYLNGREDGIEGGETLLYNEGEVRAAITPKKGRALFFRHGHGASSVLHVGGRVTGPVSKYVARINVMYEIGGA